MTLHVHDSLEQRSPEWHDQRRGMVTASAFGKLITAKTLKPASNDESRGLTATLVAERITGHTEYTFVTDAMWRGIDDEPRAIEKYAAHHAPVETCGFMVREFDGLRMGFSPDGLVGEDGLIEVKSRAPKKHLQTILADAVPYENVAQCQSGLFVSGRKWLDYVSYCGGMPLFVKRVYPDARWQEAIPVVIRAFEANAAEMRAQYADAVVGLPMTDRVEHNVVELKLA